MFVLHVAEKALMPNLAPEKCWQTLACVCVCVCVRALACTNVFVGASASVFMVKKIGEVLL